MPGPVRLGIAPIGWSNDDLPELGGDIPLERCLREAKAAGYSGVEKGGKFPMDPKVLGPLLERHGLKLVSGWFSGRLRGLSISREKKRIARQLQLFLELDVPVMVYAETTGTVQGQIDVPLAERPVMPEDEFQAYGEKLTEFAEWLAAEGCPMTFHHHMGTVIETEHEIDLLMENTGPAVGLLLDTGHLVFAGGDLLGVVQRHGARINHVHCKDVRKPILERLRRERWSFLKGVLQGVFTVPGDGMIDFRLFASLLGQIAYDGWVVVEAEQDPRKAPPLEYARKGHVALSKALKEAGFRLAA